LLKILSRITEPTEGEIVLRGRVASLLEVGTGFHPELTGRENIFLNGVILGMKRAEVARKFDEIVAFSGVEKFLDTPVKRYSSGMYVRLAFAVAAHLDPDILIVDEVLAVGDLGFQQKCLNKMGDLASGSGRTILFVSHNIEAVRKLTQRCIVLDRGRIVCEGPTGTAVEHYFQTTFSKAKVSSGLHDHERPHWAGDRQIGLIDASIDTTEAGCLPDDRRMVFRMTLEARIPVTSLFFEIKIHSLDGNVVGTAFPECKCGLPAGSTFEVVAGVLDPGLAPGRHFCTLVVLDPSRRVRDAVTNILPFSVGDPKSLPHEHHSWDSQWGFVKLETLDMEMRNLERT
jgi:lipopolysaccharide transport system ATP-binding protein